MTRTRKLRLDDLRIDSFVTADRPSGLRGTVRANAADVPGGRVDLPGEDSLGCVSFAYCYASDDTFCRSEYRTACEPDTWAGCDVAVPVGPEPAE